MAAASAVATALNLQLHPLVLFVGAELLRLVDVDHYQRALHCWPLFHRADWMLMQHLPLFGGRWLADAVLPAVHGMCLLVRRGRGPLGTLRCLQLLELVPVPDGTRQRHSELHMT